MLPGWDRLSASETVPGRKCQGSSSGKAMFIAEGESSMARMMGVRKEQDISARRDVLEKTLQKQHWVCEPVVMCVWI